MYQFTTEQREQLKEKFKKNPWIEAKLMELCRNVYEEKMLVPTEGIADWGQYYYCPDCSVLLKFRRNHPKEHECPSCHKIFTGEPYDGSWWWRINSSNSFGCYHMGLLYLLTGNEAYVRKAKEIMLEYAKYYRSYKFHGNIPYNDGGKACAQTLDEAIFLRGFAAAYDLFEEALSEEERSRIKDGLLIPGGEFLMEHRHSQIHNHEVITDAALGILGILLKREDFIQRGLYEKYGLLYQLEHGMQKDHMWFEGTFGYHYYALSNFFAFEKFAINTKYSNIHHQNYQSMLELILSYIQPDGSFPMINDINAGHGGLRGIYLYEFAYRYIKTPEILQVLNLIYQDQKRENLDAFFYGMEELPKLEITYQDYHGGDVGNTVLRGPYQQYLLFKHGNYGGEHDHYDRLSISYNGFGVRIAPDLGTTGYGAILHYDYYKNTATHNTVTINEENQPPACGTVLRYEKKDDTTYVEAMVDFKKPYSMPDSFTIQQWDRDSYQNVMMTRKLAFNGRYLVDLFIVEGAEQEATIDYSLHIIGKRITGYEEEEIIQNFSKKKPFKHLHDVVKVRHEDTSKTVYELENGRKADLYAMAFHGDTYYGLGPDNPSISDISYVLERKKGGRAVYFHVLEVYTEAPVIEAVDFQCTKDTATVFIREDGTVREISFTL